MNGEFYGIMELQLYGGNNMAVRGTAIGEVNNILYSENIRGSEKIPVSSGQIMPQVVTTLELKEYINEGVQEALESGINIKTINDNSLLGSGNITIQGGEGIEDEEMTPEEVAAILID